MTVAESEQPSTLVWRTDLIFARFDGEVKRNAGHWTIRTPGNPTFWWGNFLLFPRAPREGDFARWMALFDEEIASAQPASRHRAFGIDAPEPFALPADFAAAGFTMNEATALTLVPGRLRAPSRPLEDGVAFEVLSLPADAAAVGDQQAAVDAGSYEPVSHRVFLDRKLGRYAAMQAAGLGFFFALRERATGAVLASCGLFRDPARDDGLGRFQYVSTHPAWRRRGLCTALVHAVCRHGFETMGLRTLAIVADPADVAIRVYEAVGFERADGAWQLERPPA